MTKVYIQHVNICSKLNITMWIISYITYIWYHYVISVKLTLQAPKRTLTAQKMKFSIKDLVSKCDQIRNFLRIWSHLLKKPLMETSFFVQCLLKLFWSFYYWLWTIFLQCSGGTFRSQSNTQDESLDIWLSSEHASEICALLQYLHCAKYQNFT